MQQQKRSYKVIALTAGLVILAGAVLFVMLLMGSTSEEPEAVFGDDGVTFLGQYTKTYLYSDINSVSIEESIPAIGRKKNGAGLGDIKKGDFEVEGLGICRLFIMAEAGPYVVMNTKSGYVIISYKDPQKTKVLYDDLNNKR